MQKNTQKYIQDLLKDLEIQLNTIEAEVKDTIKTRRKLQKFYKKIAKDYQYSNLTHHKLLPKQ